MLILILYFLFLLHFLLFCPALTIFYKMGRCLRQTGMEEKLFYIFSCSF